MRSSFQNRWQVFARCGFALLLFQCCGCAHLAVVKIKPAQLPTTLVAEGPLESAKGYLAAAEHEQPLAALGHDLLAAKFRMVCWNDIQKMNRRAASTTSL